MGQTLSPADVALPVARPSVLADFREIGRDLWDYRELLYQLTLRDLRIRYKQAVMGLGWAVFMPAFVVLAGVLVRFAMATISGKALPGGGVAGLAIKSLPWAFFVGSIGFATASLVGNHTLVAKIYFPREVLPLSAVLAQAVDTLVGTVVVALALPLFGLRWSLAGLGWLPLLALILFSFTVAAGLFLSCANLFFRDVKYIVQVLLTFGIFVTPVFFEPAMFGPTGAQLMMLNPLAPVLEGLRLSLVEGHNLLEPLSVMGRTGAPVTAWEPWYLLYGLAWGLGGLAGAVILFHRLEFVFAEYI